MKPLLALLLAAVLLFSSLSAKAQEFSDEQFCTESKAAAETINAQGPQWVDKVTRQDGFDVDCEARKVTYKKFVKLNAMDMPVNWEAEMEGAMDNYYCENSSIRAAIANSWTVVVEIKLADGGGRDIYVACGQ
jgi:hypothetical protein